MNSNLNYLFVYGTLLEQYNNEYSKLLQQNSSLIGSGYIYATKYDLGEYPGIKLDPSKTNKTFGKLCLLNTNATTIFEALDFYEGYDPNNRSESLFTREKTIVYLNNTQLETWVYEYAYKL